MNPQPSAQHWCCTACRLTYTSPLPLRHPPNHRCAVPGGPMRIRKMTETDQRALAASRIIEETP